MLPLLKAITTGLSVFNAIGTVNSFTASSSTQDASTATAVPTSVPATPAPAGSASPVPGSSDLQDRFLKLLVTQMKNQDPLNPLDNAQVTSQLAQISTVSGVDRLNGTLAGLSSSLLTAQSLQSTALIGHQVLAAGSSLRLAGGAGSAPGGVELKQPADRVVVTIANAAGIPVRTLELGAQQAGIVRFEWDGLTSAGARAADGNYVFQAAAVRSGQAFAVQPLTVARVEGITLGAGGVQLNTDGAGDIGASDVRRIY